MINVHLGVPGVGFKNLEFIEDLVRPMDPTRTLLLSQGAFRQNLRSVINGGRGGIKWERREEVERVLRSAERFDVVALSQPSLLGEASKLIVSDRARRRAASRIRNLRLIFQEHSLRLHLLITNPAEYLFRVFGQASEELILGHVKFSWAAFIREIELTDSDHQVCVWNFDTAELFMEQFICEMFGQPLRYMSTNEDIYPAHLVQNTLPTTSHLSTELALRVAEYHDYYLADLAEIKKMSNIILIGAP